MVRATNIDYKDNFFSIFVDNLNPIMDLRCLWSVFKFYGKVRDVYLSLKVKTMRMVMLSSDLDLRRKLRWWQAWWMGFISMGGRFDQKWPPLAGKNEGDMFKFGEGDR
ncbi:hypothetical protein Ddye_028109 [Dipteronia dyeriana]|uniref:Uncharacterized protein n=1 Tax=Dipteronia dyeriana TaxID=168575 RepID=A0AAD9TQC9_9ROSI|nr:hypothetical protein Ddye_028109 [Dipteronia dyeriana]